MRTAKYVTDRLAWWAMKLSVYQIEEIRYRPGKLNANADSLSRNPLPDDIVNQHEVSTVETAVNLWQKTNILKDIKEEQQADPKIKQTIIVLETKPTTDSNDKRNPHILFFNIQLYCPYKQG
ncbi:unnamed protein product [Rotaria magnacalcarata]|nr:unnamed protein product [Rotaria magnacalcarata]CAF2047715.1 unnamed protein product [Rotaria magnacalcarata]CAF2122545.1 unnamed protein product [Rotaria magnacalcarata]CAF2128250.1 unnamed protein product [Rotaria magnacalcarata]CAF3812992.1 unnamed protein product [Rotaria magnacalcarata]